MDLFLFFFGLKVEVAGEAADVYAVAAGAVFTMYRLPILVPEIEILSGDEIVNAPFPNVERAPARSSCPIERRETRNEGVYSAFSLEPDTYTRPW